MAADPDPPAAFGSLRGQQYTERQVRRIARAALPDVLRERERDAGKVYCPCCHLREARWRRHFETAERVRLFVYCTQCHKTGLHEIDASQARRPGCARVLPWIIAGGCALGWALRG